MPGRSTLALLLVLTGACLPAGEHGRAGEDPVVPARATPNIEAARELDQQGVRAFREGHFEDSIRYFRAAYRIGGPPSELWNIARCRERLDDAEGAAKAIEEYLSLRGLSAQDRAEAERDAAALRARPSILTVTTRPAGATVTIDGNRVVGPTPVSIDVRPGSHTIAVRRDGYASETQPFEARFGRAVIVSLDLARADK
jgi:hypothetical protein